MTSTQFGNTPQKNYFETPNPAAPGHNLSPNPQTWNAPTVQQWNLPAPQQWNNPVITVMPTMTQSTAFHEEFLKGKPKALGITLIILGILHISMGIALFFTAAYTVLLSGIPFWGAVFNIVAGSLSVAAVSKPNLCLIKGSAGLSITISIFSVLGLILSIVDFFVYYYCYGSYDECHSLITGGNVLRGLFIVTYLLQFSVSVSMSVFGCRAQNQPNPTIPTQVFVLQNSAAAMQPSVPGSYPSYLPQQPSQLPYITQRPGGPTA